MIEERKQGNLSPIYLFQFILGVDCGGYKQFPKCTLTFHGIGLRRTEWERAEGPRMGCMSVSLPVPGQVHRPYRVPTVLPLQRGGIQPLSSIVSAHSETHRSERMCLLFFHRQYWSKISLTIVEKTKLIAKKRNYEESMSLDRKQCCHSRGRRRCRSSHSAFPLPSSSVGCQPRWREESAAGFSETKGPFFFFFSFLSFLCLEDPLGADPLRSSWSGQFRSSRHESMVFTILLIIFNNPVEMSYG